MPVSKPCVTLKSGNYEVEFQVTITGELVVTMRVAGEHCMKPTTAVVTQTGNPMFTEKPDSYLDLITLIGEAVRRYDDVNEPK